MKTLVAHSFAIVGWLSVAFGLSLAGGLVAVFLFHREELNFDRWLVLGGGGILLVVVGSWLVRWARSALGKSAGSAVGRTVLALGCFALVATMVTSDSYGSASDAKRDYIVGASIALVIFAGALVLEAAWHRSPTRRPRSLPDPHG
jgi:hypothetical protein